MTLAQLKRDAKDGKISLELLPMGIWKNGVPDRIKGVRKTCGANSVAIFLERSDGKGMSECGISRASLIDYNDDYLTLYYPGYREPNKDEQKCFDEWKNVEQTERYQKNLEYDVLTDYNQCYYEKERFFKERHMEYLLGFNKHKGMKWDWNKKLISDENIKGDICLKYKVYR